MKMPFRPLGDDDDRSSALGEHPALRTEIEGHTCNTGTAGYNRALGDRRASAVRDCLTSRGISTSRMNAIRDGEERPKYENAREETRSFHRRAALVVNLQ
jgi:outer membrane protein OmpA-like peptidoglycan-associated protein